MNRDKLKALESAFMLDYPLGFESEEIQMISKKHKVEKMRAYVLDNFSEDDFEDERLVSERFTKLISMSSLVSVFEKARYRDVSKNFEPDETQQLSRGIQEFLYGNQALGFDLMVSVLERYKLAKWPILTVLGVYMYPDVEVLVKPTTAKSVLNYFEVSDFKYVSKPSYFFYKCFREFINELKSEVNKSLQVDNAAFCGFLMMTIQ